MRFCSTNHSFSKKHYLCLMRKKWTAQGEVTDSLIKFREKRKWQIALRRYVLEEKRCAFYAPFFGADIATFREWIELQFEEGFGWHNFSAFWQFDHIVPITYFDFGDMDDMKLAWNFTNIRVETTILNKNRDNRIDVLAAKSYFEDMYQKTQYDLCRKMIEKIEGVEVSQIASNEKLKKFVADRRIFLDTLSSFSNYQYEQLNLGMELEEILAEKGIIDKWK